MSVEMEFENYDGDTDYSDPEDFIDDVSDEELLKEDLQTKPAHPDRGMMGDCLVVVDNVPQVEDSKVEKLKAVLTSRFKGYGPVTVTIHRHSGAEKTSGMAFLEYTDPQHASKAVKERNNFKLDQRHTLKVNLFTDSQKYNNQCQNWTQPEKQQYKDMGNIRYYLEEPDCNDQFVSVYMCKDTQGQDIEVTAIFLNTATEPILLEKRERWTEKYTRWSPKGAYLATIHQKGVALWGGPQYKKQARFMHLNVSFIDFSPCETYLVTFTVGNPNGGSQAAPPTVMVWDIMAGKLKRQFSVDVAGDECKSWPIFKWSSDGKYFVRKTKGALQIYETPSMMLLEKKSLNVPNVSQFSWSPNDNLLAYWVAEQGQIPARVTIVQIPSRREVRVKNLSGVQEIRLNWHNKGKFLCVKVDRYNKSKKIHYSTFEIFHLTEKQVPVDIVELKDQVQAFAWEPNGNKFCCLHGTPGYPSASFYEVKNLKVELVATLERRSATHLFWSPLGQFIVLASVEQNNPSGFLEFVDTADMTVMNTAEHHGANDVGWDPTGRYLITCCTSWYGYQKEQTGACFWSFQGKCLRKMNFDRLRQLMMRPRPPTLLSQDQLKKVKKDLKSYAKEFEVKDRQRQSRVSKDILDTRRRLMNKYRSMREQWAKLYRENAPYRLELRNGVNTDESDSKLHDDIMEVTIEVMISEEEILITDDAEMPGKQ